MRDAFAAMTKDEQFIKESEKMGLEISLIRGEEMNGTSKRQCATSG
jgi:hypothetical protein